MERRHIHLAGHHILLPVGDILLVEDILSAEEDARILAVAAAGVLDRMVDPEVDNHFAAGRIQVDRHTVPEEEEHCTVLEEPRIDPDSEHYRLALPGDGTPAHPECRKTSR